MRDRLVLDAGPLYALASRQDIDHQTCTSGFSQLAQENVELIAPLPIVFEVHKLLAQRESPQVAQLVLRQMMKMTVIPVTLSDFQAILQMLQKLQGWGGSLEDATVLLITQRLKCPIWTLNYRDFSRFKDLRFWNPETLDE